MKVPRERESGSKRGRPYTPKIKMPDDPPVQVPDPWDMDDETFLKHLEFRHADECQFETTPVARHAVDVWLKMYRHFHDRLHDLATPGQHDHYHDEGF